jgi:Protein of unknown function (DUF3489)
MAKTKRAKKSKPAPKAAADQKSIKGRPGSRRAMALGLLRRAQGATIADVMKATGWQPHSVRGFLAGIVHKRLGLPLSSDKSDLGRVYRIVDDTGGKTARARRRQADQCPGT